MGNDAMSWLMKTKFWLLVILSIPSIICSLLIFVYFYQQRKKILIHQHLILVLVITSFVKTTTDVPFAISYYQYGKVIFGSNAFCLWWNWWDYSLAGILIFAMAWGSIERHFLIFHNALMATRRKRVIFHVIPMVMACVYPLIFYFAAIILNSCENEWDYETFLCLEPCYLYDQLTLSTFDSFANIVFPVGVITLANAGLIVRVLWQKRNRQINIRRQLKLAIPLLVIAVVYIVLFMPLTINGVIYTYTSSSIAIDIQVEYFLFLSFVLNIFLPFVSLPFLQDFKKIVRNRQQTTVAPAFELNPRITHLNT